MPPRTTQVTRSKPPHGLHQANGKNSDKIITCFAPRHACAALGTYFWMDGGLKVFNGVDVRLLLLLPHAAQHLHYLHPRRVSKEARRMPPPLLRLISGVVLVSSARARWEG